MHITDVIAELARQVRGQTISLLEACTSNELTWAPSGTANHILWHAGHAVWVQDILTIEPLTGNCELPADWPASFGDESHPKSVLDWPSRQLILNQLRAQLERILRLLELHASEIESKANVRSVANGWPLLQGMIHGWHDEARHQGEMYLLLKMQRLGSLQ